MYVAPTSTSNDNDAAMRRWAPCSPLNDIADSNGSLLLPTIYSTRAGGGGGEVGRGLRMSSLSTAEGVNGDTGFFWMTRCTTVNT